MEVSGTTAESGRGTGDFRRGAEVVALLDSGGYAARVAVTASSSAKLDAAANLGADILINYTAEDFAHVMTEAGGADIVLDTVLGRT
jgi:NADPH:quinone reductase-like Zn-dependent oxidoreductase